MRQGSKTLACFFGVGVLSFFEVKRLLMYRGVESCVGVTEDG
jgi:hypothetical protein